MNSKAEIKGMGYDLASLYPNQKMLSSSQVLTYDEDPALFHKEYVIGIRRKESQPMSIGKIFSALYADRKFKFKEALQAAKVTNARIYRALEDAIKLFPIIPKRACEYPLKCKYRGWKFRATLDGYHQNIDIENKTGQTVWDQQRADESIQVTFQYWVKWKRDNELFKTCYVNWVDLRASSSKLVHTFETYRSLEEINDFERNVIDKVINGIENEIF